jgi:hypothetical protein
MPVQRPSASFQDNPGWSPLTPQRTLPRAFTRTSVSPPSAVSSGMQSQQTATIAMQILDAPRDKNMISPPFDDREDILCHVQACKMKQPGEKPAARHIASEMMLADGG